MEELLNEFPVTNTTVPSFAQGLKILLVDEDALSLMNISSMLEELSFKVVTVEQTSTALSLLREQKNTFKLVITNVNMPDMDNLSFLHEIKNEIPVIVMSSNFSVAERAIAEGACKFIKKPVALKDMINVWQHADWKRKRQNKENDRQVTFEEKGENRRGSKGVEIDESRTLLSSPMEGNIIKKASVTFRPPSTGILIKEDVNSVWPSTDVLRKLESGVFSISNTGCELHGNFLLDPMSRRIQNEGKITDVIIDDEKNDLHNTKASTKQEGSKLKRQFCDKDGQKQEKKLKTNLEIINSGSSTIGGRGKIKNGGNNNTFNKQKSRIVWTPDLHLKFTEAINTLGYENANPKMIAEKMNEPSITRSQISSHLQKYKVDIKRLNETGAKSLPFSSQSSCTNARTSFSAPLERPSPLISQHAQESFSFGIVSNTLSDVCYVSTTAQASETSLPSLAYMPQSAPSNLSAAMFQIPESPTFLNQNPDLAFAYDGTKDINEELNSVPPTTTLCTMVTNLQEVQTSISRGRQNLNPAKKPAPSLSEYEDILRILDSDSVNFNDYAYEPNLDEKGYEWLKKNLNGKKTDPY